MGDAARRVSTVRRRQLKCRERTRRAWEPCPTISAVDRGDPAPAVAQAAAKPALSQLLDRCTSFRSSSAFFFNLNFDQTLVGVLVSCHIGCSSYPLLRSSILVSTHARAFKMCLGMPGA